jgi:hypothetical protein
MGSRNPKVQLFFYLSKIMSAPPSGDPLPIPIAPNAADVS